MNRNKVMEYFRYLMHGDEGAAAAHTRNLWAELEGAPESDYRKIISTYLLSHRLARVDEVPTHVENMIEGRVPGVTVINQVTRGNGLLRVVAVLLLLLLLPTWYIAYKWWQRGKELEALAEQNGRIEAGLNNLGQEIRNFRDGTIGEQGVATNIRRDLNPSVVLGGRPATAGDVLRDLVNRGQNGKVAAPAIALPVPPPQINCPSIPTNLATKDDIAGLARQCSDGRPASPSSAPRPVDGKLSADDIAAIGGAVDKSFAKHPLVCRFKAVNAASGITMVPDQP